MLGPQEVAQEDIEKLEKVHQSAAKMVSSPEHMIYKEMLRDIGLDSLAKRWIRRDLKPTCTYVNRNDKGSGAKLSMLVGSHTEKLRSFWSKQDCLFRGLMEHHGVDLCGGPLWWTSDYPL